jgi:hypothetical protein
MRVFQSAMHFDERKGERRNRASKRGGEGLKVRLTLMLKLSRNTNPNQVPPNSSGPWQLQ